MEMRYCADIGMWAIDRKIATSCIWKTDYCDKTCYNNKLFDLYPAMHGKDNRNEEQWLSVTGDKFNKVFSRKRKGNKNRFRFMTRGEAFDTIESVRTAYDILIKNPDTIFWIPTRVWRDVFISTGEVLQEVINLIIPLKNARVLASLDPSNDNEEHDYVRKILRWSTMFYGNNSFSQYKTFKCPKTFKDLHGHCEICKAGCFNNKKRVDVLLKEH